VKPDYIMIGDGTVNEDGVKSIDLLDIVIEISKAGQWLLLKIKDGINYDNDYNPVVNIVSKELTSTEVQYLKRGYAELVVKDLVRRIKQGHYMINPNALIPPNYDEAIKVWDEASKKE
jgi:hypothetical protein